ncbi:hypothetical protein ACFZBU_36535 [Embleya sp. NPDC008237]|uniref:hypothetical protein n=1 Tax=Embleya sp. NPDC008237 TaxID=3363978 RepID=UPI0036EDF5AE
MATITAGRPAVEAVHLRPPGELTAEREEWLVDGLVDALPGLRMRELFTLRRDMFRSADLITVAVERASGAAVGVLCSRTERLATGATLLNVTTQFVAEQMRHGFVFRAGWGAHFAALGHGGDPAGLPRLIALKTYNPVVLCGMRAFTRIPGTSLYPDCRGGPQDPERMQTAERIAAVMAPGYPFDPKSGVISGAGVPADLYPHRPLCRDAEINDHFARNTRPGDRVLCVFDVGTVEAAAALLSAFRAGPATPQEPR